MPYVASNQICLEVITIDSVFKKDEYCYLQVFLKEWKYNQKRWSDISLIT